MTRLNLWFLETTWRRDADLRKVWSAPASWPFNFTICTLQIFPHKKETNITSVKKSLKNQHIWGATWREGIMGGVGVWGGGGVQLLHLCCSNFCINRVIIQPLSDSPPPCDKNIPKPQLEGRWNFFWQRSWLRSGPRRIALVWSYLWECHASCGFLLEKIKWKNKDRSKKKCLIFLLFDTFYLDNRIYLRMKG